MRVRPGLIACAALGLSASSLDAMPLAMMPHSGTNLPMMEIADGCGPGLVRGRRGICLRKPAVFFHSGRNVHRGCGKPIGAGLRTPC